MDKLEQLINKLRSDIKKDQEDSLDRLETRITSKINEHTDQRIGLICEELEKMKTVGAEHNKRILELEKQAKVRNIILFGVEEDEKSYEGLENKMINIFNNCLQVKCHKNEIEIIRRMGRKTENKLRPIIVTFTTFGKKLAILKNKTHLKDKNYYIKEDFPPQILEKRKELQADLEKARSEGKTAYIRYDRLIVRDADKSSKYASDNNSKSSKKRELVITPPNQKGNNYNTTNHQSNQSLNQQAAKKSKVKPHKTTQSSLTHFLQKQGETSSHAARTPDSGDSSDE